MSMYGDGRFASTQKSFPFLPIVLAAHAGVQVCYSGVPPRPLSGSALVYYGFRACRWSTNGATTVVGGKACGTFPIEGMPVPCSMCVTKAASWLSSPAAAGEMSGYMNPAGNTTTHILQ